MSDSIKQAVDQAYGTIVSQLAAPYFFEKLAAHGVKPRSEQEAAEMWELANKLHVLYTAEQEKAAAAQASDWANANAKLDQVLSANGLRGQGHAPVEKAAAFRGVADVAADDPKIAEAVLVLQAAAAAATQNVS
jgi:hypothetical protein